MVGLGKEGEQIIIFCGFQTSEKGGVGNLLDVIWQNERGHWENGEDTWMSDIYGPYWATFKLKNIYGIFVVFSDVFLEYFEKIRNYYQSYLLNAFWLFVQLNFW